MKQIMSFNQEMEKKNTFIYMEKTRNQMRKKINKPNAKKKVRIAENMLPIIAETTKLQTSLTLSTKFPKEHKEDMEKRDGYG